MEVRNGNRSSSRITYSGGACSGNLTVEFGNSILEFPQWKI